MDSDTNTKYPGEKYISDLEDASAYVLALSGRKPDLIVTLGSGLGNVVELLENALEIPYADIPHFPLSTVSGHKGSLVLGTLGKRSLAVLRGRAHLYEGYSAAQVAFPVRCLIFSGARGFIVTNACGSVDPNLRPGMVMGIRNHISLLSEHPSIGVYHPRLGQMFHEMTTPYDAGWLSLAQSVAFETNTPYSEGVYAFNKGPAYETAADVVALRMLGASVVGMSTVPEVTAAKQLNMRILGLSFVTNLAAGVSDSKPSHNEILDEVAKEKDQLILFLQETIMRMQL